MDSMQHDSQQSNYPQGKLVLPPQRQEALPQPGDATVFRSSLSQRTGQHVRPEQLIRPQAPQVQGSLVDRVSKQLRADPAYRVLAIAIVGVLIAGIVFVAFASSMFASPSPKQPPLISKTQQATATAASTQPDANATDAATDPVPTLFPVPTTTVSNNPNGPLTVEVTKVPQRVMNGSKVPVTVQTSQPRTTVKLFVLYSGAFGNFSSKSTATDDTGMATINWNVAVLSMNHSATVTAAVYAVATDQHGQQITSQPVTVEVVLHR